MFIISKEAMEGVMSLKDKMADPQKKVECIADVENMIETKESLLARAEWGSCCGNICNLVPRIDNEIQMLRSILGLLREGSTQAASLLDDYVALVQEGYRPEPDHW
ncbi:MAG: hypothetical protein E3J50_00650 [Dehalococcoidia bacterium]|jgi:hypothetical protein|nr:MAG: hypothetical protein E3J50_00650 [Dehalococcoidia bacterium]